MVEDQPHQKNINRRSAIRALGSITGGGLLINKFGLVRANDRPIRYIQRKVHTNHEEVKDGGAPDRKPIYREVPQGDKERMEASERAMDEILDNIRENSEFSDDLISVMVKTLNENHDQEIIVQYETEQRGDKNRKPKIPLSELNSIVPTNIIATPNINNKKHEFNVRINKVQTEIDDGCNTGPHFNSNYNKSIPGGCEISQEGTQTSATPAYSTELDETVMLGSGHGLSKSDDVYQPSNSSVVGEVDRSMDWHAADYGSIRKKNGSDFKYKMASKGGGYRSADIDGVVTWPEVKNKEQYSRSAHKQGRTTGHLTGEVASYGKDMNNYRWVALDTVRAGGDSGGPYYDTTINRYYTEVIEIMCIHHKKLGGGSDPCAQDDLSLGGFIADAEANLHVRV